jgi:KEOPS complex subunit Cgi121
MIEDRQAFLESLRRISREYGTRIVCFNADMMADRHHAGSAVHFARRSWEEGSAIANTFEMEALLYAAGSRQCNVGLKFGIHEGENHLYIWCDPDRDDRAWNALSALLEYTDPGIYEVMDEMKRSRLIDLFGITPMELGALGAGTTITDLILERVALLQVLR